MTDFWASLCKGRPCVACGADDGTIVPAHANAQEYGKGMGCKAASWTVIPLCLKCHSWLDAGPGDRFTKAEAWKRWWGDHMRALFVADLVPFAIGHTKPKPLSSSKVLPRREYSR